MPYAPLEMRLSKKEMKLKKAKARIARDRFRDMCFANELQAALKFEVDPDIVQMRAPFT